MTYQTKHPPRLRFISAVLSLAMLLTLLPTTAFAASSYKLERKGTVDYVRNEGATIWRVANYFGSESNLTLESQFEGQNVFIINEKVFQNKTNLTHVTLPTNLGEIYEEAFAGCSNLETVVVPRTLHKVWEKGFQNCTSLKSFTMDGLNWATADTYAFAGCTSLESFTITGPEATLNDNAFEGCTSLKSVKLSGSTATIKNNVFKDCTNLEEITLPKEIKSFGDNVFAGCTNLKKIIYKGKLTDWENCPAKEKIPATVKVECTVPLDEYDISVCGIKANEANCSDMLKDGKVEFRPSSNYLKLNNVNLSYNDASTAAIDSTLDRLTIAGNGDDTIVNTSGPAIKTTGKLHLDSSHIVLQGSPAIVAESVTIDAYECWYRTAPDEPYAEYTESVDIGNTNYFEIIHSRYDPNEEGILLWIDGKRMPKIEGWELYDVFGDGTALLGEDDYDVHGEKHWHCTLDLENANWESTDTAILTSVDQLMIMGSGTIKGGKKSIRTEYTGTEYGADVSIDDANLTFTGGMDLNLGASITNSTVKINGWTDYGIKVDSNSGISIYESDVTIASGTGKYALCPQIVRMYGNSTLRLQGANSIVDGGNQTCIIYADKYWYRTSPDGKYTEDTKDEFYLDPSYTYYELTTIDPYAVKTYDLWVAGEQVTETNQNDVLGDGTVQYDPGTHTLTLKDADINGDSTKNIAIHYAGNDTLTVTGSATLYGDMGIYSEASELHIENANLTFATETTAETVGSAYWSAGFQSNSGMTIRNSTMKIESAFASGQGTCVHPYFSGDGDFVIQNSNVSVDDGVRCEYGLLSNASLTIENSKVTIPNAHVRGIASVDDMTISGADTWLVAAIDIEDSKYVPIWCKSVIDLQDGLEFLEDTTENGVKRMVIGNRANQVFTVTFAMNGHGEQEPTQKVKNGASPAIPAYPDAEGWYFAGWYADPECTEAADFSLPIQKNTIFYAKWDKMHTIHFELNGHGNEGYYNNDQEIRDGSALGELGLAWDDEWYFAGWFTDPELTTKVNPETIVTGDITCYAKWLKPEGITQYKVSFDLNASDVRWDQDFDGWGEWDDAHRVITAETYFDYDNENEQFVQLINVEPVIGYAQPERDGYTFKGWYTAPEGGEKMEEKYDVSMGTMEDITEDRTFYAQWEKIGGEPSNPDKPTEPEQPEQPTEPSNPEKPTEPENPDKPTEPEQPTTPTEPSEPEKPSQPENPDKPSEPEQPGKHSEPEKPSQPENPEKPSDPEQPTTPSTPGNDGGGAGAAILLAGGAVVIGAGVAAVGVAAYDIGTELAAWLMLPAGAGMPTTRGELAVVLWKQAGCPAVPMEAPLSETEIALRWAIDHQLADEDAAPEESVSTAEVFKALKKAKDI